MSFDTINSSRTTNSHHSPLPHLLLIVCQAANFNIVNNQMGSNFNVVNQCSYTVWAAASPGGGQKLEPGASWSFEVAAGSPGRIWARTGCSFDSNGKGHCQTGDCGGVLRCTGYGDNPNTLVEYTLGQPGAELDYLDISLVAGFNVPLSFLPTSGGCSSSGASCAANVTSKCPSELQTPGGCNDPCTVFQTADYCCSQGSSCNPTQYSQFFKNLCPNAYSYPDDNQAIFTCPGSSNYQVVFCP